MGGALSIAAWPGHLGHGICGPWGCGPPLQALIACHLAWFVALIPPAMMLSSSKYSSGHLLRTSGFVLVILAGLGFLAVLANQYFVWWPQATLWQQSYFWQRYGFTIVTAVDIPLTQLLLIGVALTCRGVKRSRVSGTSRPTESRLMDQTSDLNFGVPGREIS